MHERYVLLGLAGARAEWFRVVGQWSTSAALPAEFIRCVSAEELRARLASGRTFSAALVDAQAPGLDRDLFGFAATSGCAVLVVDDEPTTRDWREVGAAGVLARAFSRDELLEVLSATSVMVGTASVQEPAGSSELRASGRLIAVTGPGGTGASVSAIALAQGLSTAGGRPGAPGKGRPAGAASSVLLADFCRVADQAMLHDARDVVPGVQEVVEAHRTSVPAASVVRDQTFDVPDRGYRLLLGLRRPRHWVAIRPRAFAATLDSLRRLADVVVADVEADVEGEADAGSSDVEDRNVMARTTLIRADATVVVGEASMKGVFALVRTLSDLLGLGVPGDRLLPVLNGGPRSPRARAACNASLAELLGASAGTKADRLVAPVHLRLRDVDAVLRDGVPMPAPGPRALARAVEAVIDRQPVPPAPSEPPLERVALGSLAGFTSQEPPTS